MISPENKAIYATFFALLLGKIIALGVWGPVLTPDSSGYAQFADIMLANDNWFRSENIDTGGYPATSFRSIGYPLVIALAKVLTNDHWVWLIMALQMVLSLLATYFVYRLTAKLGNSTSLGLIAALIHGFGQSFLLDQCVLTDSLNASLLIIMLGLIGLGILDRRQPSIIELLGLGCLMAIAFLIREAGYYLQYLYFPLLLYWGFILGKNRFYPLLVLLVFALPMLISVEAYKSWNEYRTGKRYITTASQTSMYFPLLLLEKRGVPAKETDPLLKDAPALLPIKSTTHMRNVWKIDTYLHNAHGFDAVDIARYGMSTFLRLWTSYPFDMTMVTLSNIKARQTMAAFMPVRAVALVPSWKTGARVIPSRKELKKLVLDENRYDKLFLYLGLIASRIVSILLSIAFVVGAPLLIIQEIRQHRSNLKAFRVHSVLIFIYWLIYFGYTAAYAMVHLEIRYLMPVMPFVLITGLLTSLPLADRLKQYMADRKTG